MFGAEVLEHSYSNLKSEIEQVITTTYIPLPSKTSKEKTKAGQVVYSGRDFNAPLEMAFRERGWQKRRATYPEQARFFIDVDFCKEKVGLEIQFGKYAFVQHDFYKFLYLFALDVENQIDVGVEVVPSANLQRRMYTGPANFESIVAAMKSHPRNEPPMPLWILGIDITT